ncbi:MAG: cytosolic protein [Francisellaceae bacterium]|nr:cytosolic protein [Francisellaceae bacterium]
MKSSTENNEMLQPSQMDATWKEALQHYLKDFFKFCWANAYTDIDWDKGFEFLEQELQTIKLDEELGKRVVDKLIKVYLKNGQEQWCLIHLEVESSSKANFPERMYVYDAKLYEKYRRNIASMAILVDRDKNWYPGPYQRALWGSETYRKYDIIKVLDYQAQKIELSKLDNPFALVILWQLTAIETHNNPKARLFEKTQLTRMLYAHGKSADDIRLLYRFLDGLLSLNEQLSYQYHESVKQIEEELKVNYMTTAEKIGFQQGIQEGMQQGMQQGEAKILLMQLKTKFNEVPESYVKKIQAADDNTLSQWAINFIKANSLDDVFKH